jgi:hypothetical protein
MTTKSRVSIAEMLLDDAQLARLEVLGAAQELAYVKGEIEHQSFVTGDPRMKHLADQMEKHLRVQRAGVNEIFVALRDLRDTPGFKRASREMPWDGKHERRRGYDRRAVQRESAQIVNEEIAATYEGQVAA